ncbi:hypothetical protein TNCV_2927551 [Trichonephila clavipes]|nr:hypothetical protein TNCV_2927551 [Trichonephila clavipes]
MGVSSQQSKTSHLSFNSWRSYKTYRESNDGDSQQSTMSQGLPSLFPFHQSHERFARRLFRVPPCRAGTIHFQTSMPSSGFEPKPYGTAVSVTNHYTE